MTFKVRFREGIDFNAKFNGVRTILVDQQFSPESKNAQSGQAVAEAIGKADIFANALKGSANGSAVALKDVSPLEHEIGVKVGSKNIIPFPYPEDTSTGSGVTFTAQADGGISATGTATGQKNFTLYYGDLLADGNITFSLSGEFTNLTAVLILRDEEKNTLLNRNVETSFTANLADYPSATKMEIVIKRKVNAEVSGTVYPQLELGTTATAYTPFADVSSVTLKKCGKNVFELDGYSATDKAGIISNNQGTMLSTTEAVNGVTITQTKYSKPTDLQHYDNGYFTIKLKEHLEKGRIYAFSCDIEILSNPLSSSGILLLQQGDGAGIGAIRITNDSAFEVGKKYRISKNFEYHILSTIPDRKFLEFRNSGMSLILSNIQIELGETATEYEPRIEPISYTPNADGTVDGVTSLYHTTTLLTDTEGVIISAEYNKDLNKAFDSLVNAIISLGGNV